jgi:hypothetical protein
VTTPDLHVDTDVLHASGRILGQIADAAQRIGDGHARLGEVVWAAGSDAAAQGLDSFLCAWMYGVRCIAHQAGVVGGELTTCGCVYEAAESSLAAAAGGAPLATRVDVPRAHAGLDEPLRPVARFVRGQQTVQLSAAKHVSELIPGDPEEVAAGARVMMHFATELGEGRRLLTEVSLGGWSGLAATVVLRDLQQLLDRLRRAEIAFEEAGTATAAYARAHADARSDAARALAMWQSAKPASDAAHGAVTATAVTGPEDPDAVLVRAGALCRDAQDRFDVAARALHDILVRAEEGHPKHPGLLATIRRGLRSFGEGFGEGAAGFVEGPVVLIAAAKTLLDPVQASRDPAAWRGSWEALAAGLGRAVTHPEALPAAMVDWDGIKQDPIRGLAKLLPDALMIGATVTRAGALREAESDYRLRRIAEIRRDTLQNGESVLGRADAAIARRELAERGIDARSAVGRAMRKQLEPPFGMADDWRSVRLKPGDRILVGADKVVIRVGDVVPTDVRELYESVQMPAWRTELADGSVSGPLYPSKMRLYEVGPEGLDAAETTALVNPQFGIGGGDLVSIPQLEARIGDGSLISHDVHYFDTDTLRARIEDPEFLKIDPDLPMRPLDPDHERLMGRLEAGRDEVGGSARQLVLTAGVDQVLHQHDGGTG